MGIPVLDIIVGSIMALAIVRGLFVGMIREGFSVGAIGAVVLGIVYGSQPAGLWLDTATAGEIGGQPAKWIGGVMVGVSAGVVVGALGRYLRRGARIVGLGMADRVGGGAIGAAEGALIATIVILGANKMFGPEHPAVFNSQSVAMMSRVEYAMETGDITPLTEGLPSVASGPPRQQPQQQRR
jgi:uncharacterized membrane protein required for colicin V production